MGDKGKILMDKLGKKRQMGDKLETNEKQIRDKWKTSEKHK